MDIMLPKWFAMFIYYAFIGGWIWIAYMFIKMGFEAFLDNIEIFKEWIKERDEEEA